MLIPSIVTSAASLVGSNLLLTRVISAVDGMGVPFQLGHESQFLSSLQNQGLGGRHLQTLERVINGRAVKLHAYRGAVEALESFRCKKNAPDVLEDDVEKELRGAWHSFWIVHNQAIGSLQDRGLIGDFWDHCIVLVPILFQIRYVPHAGVRDLSYEYRNFVEDRGLMDLFDVARWYVSTAVDVANAQAKK